MPPAIARISPSQRLLHDDPQPSLASPTRNASRRRLSKLSSSVPPRTSRKSLPPKKKVADVATPRLPSPISSVPRRSRSSISSSVPPRTSRKSLPPKKNVADVATPRLPSPIRIVPRRSRSSISSSSPSTSPLPVRVPPEPVDTPLSSVVFWPPRSLRRSSVGPLPSPPSVIAAPHCSASTLSTVEGSEAEKAGTIGLLQPEEEEIDDGADRCALCHKKEGELKCCSRCDCKYHVRDATCLDQPNAVAVRIEKKKNWLCPRCIVCSTCAKPVDDLGNRECNTCLRAWHGSCSKGKGEGTMFDWMCNRCKNKLHGGAEKSSSSPAKDVKTKKTPSPANRFPVHVPSPPESPPVELEPSKRKRGRPRKDSMLPRPSPANRFPDPMHVPSPPKSPPVEPELPKRGRGRPRKDSMLPSSVVRKAQVSQNLDSGPSTSNKSLASRRRPNSRLASIDMGQLYMLAKIRAATKNVVKLEGEEKEEPEEELSSPERSLSPKMQEEWEGDEKMFQEDEGPSMEGKSIFAGGDYIMTAEYDSPYPAHVKAAPLVYICPYCLAAFSKEGDYALHSEHCKVYHPPGNEIYRDEELSFFEVVGAVQKNYCRRLCRFGKMFLSSKTLLREVHTFKFYILTEVNTRGHRLVGYFSKENKPEKNNNLSCILTLPSEQRKGFGRLLIDLSYHLSGRERMIGSPERPLSDAGLRAYRAYWKSTIIAYLRASASEDVKMLSIHDMSLATRILPNDLVGQLLIDGIIGFKKDHYYLRISKRAFAYPLSAYRGRHIVPSKLYWEPYNDISQLDPTALNFYSNN